MTTKVGRLLNDSVQYGKKEDKWNQNKYQPIKMKSEIQNIYQSHYVKGSEQQC